MRTLSEALAMSHRDQLAARDYQAAAIDAAEWLGVEFDSDEYTELQSSPDPGCTCEACSDFDWDD